MKTICSLSIFPREFYVLQEKIVAIKQAPPFGEDHIPLVMRANARFSALKADMSVWAGLTYVGEDYRIGRDVLSMELTISPHSFISHSRAEPLYASGVTLGELHDRLCLIRRAILAAKRMTWISRFSETAVDRMFGIIFGNMAELESNLAMERIKRANMIIRDMPSAPTSPVHSRFRLTF